MTYSDPTKRMAEIVRLLDQFEEYVPRDESEGDRAERERKSYSRIQGYMLATEDYPFGDLEEAVIRFIKRKVPGMMERRAPTPPELAAACAAVARERDEQRALAIHKARRLSAPQPILDEPTPEERARGKAMLDRLAQSIGSMNSDEVRSNTARNELANRVNAEFYPSMEETEMRKRLGL